ncbi:hypothetical protein [Thermosyntropha sp.]|uniref:hypothetical protein n=1 Tax=Thermosyntropha sp. TaxID=2740820 RepID=UPI0025F135DE|nr:hypothetical protein [Thermosyntropha sp.]MBO8158817.1 hypothetical protein [Thermosyntropha sp.]
MILVIKGGRVLAYHADTQKDDIINKYLDSELVQVPDNEVQFDEEGWPLLPQNTGVNINTLGSTEQRIADLEVALAAIIGGAV